MNQEEEKELEEKELEERSAELASGAVTPEMEIEWLREEVGRWKQRFTKLVIVSVVVLGWALVRPPVREWIVEGWKQWEGIGTPARAYVSLLILAFMWWLVRVSRTESSA